MRDSSNLAVGGRHVIGDSIQMLWLKLAESKTFQQRIQVVEEYLLPFAINARPQTLVMRTAQFTSRYQGAVRIQDLANYSSLSLRQVDYFQKADHTPGPRKIDLSQSAKPCSLDVAPGLDVCILRE